MKLPTVIPDPFTPLSFAIVCICLSIDLINPPAMYEKYPIGYSQEL